MLAKRNKFNLSVDQNREKLRSYQRSFSPNFSIRFARQTSPVCMVVVGKNVSLSAVKRNSLKRACYEVLEGLIARGDTRSFVIRVQKAITSQEIKRQLSAQISQLPR